MFTPYWIDFRSCSEIGRIKCEQCLGKSNGPDRSGVELFTPYQIRYAPCLFWFGKKTSPRVQENDNEFPFQKLSRSAEQPVHMHKERSVPKNYLIRKYHFRNQAFRGIIVTIVVPDQLNQVRTEGLSDMAFKVLR